jgi:hypothetical protein
MLGRLVTQTSLTSEERSAMFQLLSEHFDGVTREVFDRDLAEKNWAVLIESNGELLGFSTLRVYEAHISGETITVVCSGDTIVSRRARGSAAFPRAWILSVYQLRERYRSGRLIWLLLTSGFRTYRFLPVFWSEFYPRASTPTPHDWQDMLDHLASAHYGALFDIRTGLVRFPHPQKLRDPLAGITDARAADPDVAFFLHRNPGHAWGDELACIADLDPSNLTAAGRRVVFGVSR